MIIDGIKHSQSVYSSLQQEISTLSSTPKLTAVLVGESPASLRYIAQKRKWADFIGMDFELLQFSEDISQEELLSTIDWLNSDSSVDGYIVQLPLPKHIDTDSILDSIAPEKDVDGFHPVNQWKTVIGDANGFAPCTPAGIMEIFSLEDISLSGKVVCVLGRSNIVGKPMISLLTNAWATVIACNSRTPDIASFTKQADIVVLAIWQPEFLTQDMISDSAIIIDVWFTVVDGTIFWDADYKNIEQNGNRITPVPGWVWRMTVAMLLKNTLKSHKIANNIK